MPTYKYIVGPGEKIEKVIVTKDRYIIEIPVEGVAFSQKPEIERHLNALFEKGVRIELLAMKPVEETEHAKNQEINKKIEEFVTHLSPSSKKLFLILDDSWKPKSEVDKSLRFENNPQKLAGVLSGITKQAKKAGFGGEKLIEHTYEGGELKYRLTDLGVKIKEKLSSQ